jgi:hypothetical protein
VRYFLILLALCVVASAQPNAILHGVVTDPSDAAIPGATVIVTGPDGSVKTTTADQQGRYSIAGLPPGAYTVRIGATGFTLFEKTGVALSPGQSVGLDAKLTVTLEKQEVTVNAEDKQTQISTDPANNAGALVLKGADLDALSDDPDDLASDLQALAGPAAGPNGGQIFIDGFSGGRLPPKESIREIRINSNPFAAEYDRLGFGRIEIFTKPGTDKFRGQAFMNFGDRIFNSRNPFSTAPTQPPYQSRQFGGNISGPLGKKASFFFDGEERDIDENAVIVGSVLDPSLNIVPFNSAIVTPIRRMTVSPRLDYQLNSNNTLTARYTYTDQTSLNQGLSQFSLPTRAYSLNNTEQTAQLTETAVLNARTINETRFQYIRTRNDQNGVSNTPTINVSGAFIGGGAPFSVNLTNTDTYELQNYTSMTHGTHAIKFGARLREYKLNSQSTSNFNGTFTFAGGRFPVLTANNQIQLDASGQQVLTQLQSIAVYRQTQLLLNQGLSPAQVRSLGYGPNQFTLNGGTPLAGVNQFDAGLFIQDDWRLRPNLTVSAGLRYEGQTNISDHFDLAPRIGIAWAPGAAKATLRPKMVIRGGFGIFYDRFNEDLTLNSIRYNGVTEQQFVVRNPDFYPNVPSIASLSSALQTQAVYKVDSHLRAPYIMQSAIGIERQLPKNITLSLNYTNSRGLHNLRTRNINAPLPGTYDPNNPNSSGVRPFGNTAGDIYLYESSGVFKQNQLLTSVQARVNPRISLFGFYSLSKANSNTDSVGTFPANQYDLSTEYGRAGFDVRNRAFIGGSMTGPYAISLSPFIMLASGAPFNITAGRDLNGDGLFTDRPAFATDLSRPSVVHTAFGVFDTNPLPGQTIIPRNYGQSPGVISINMRLSRTWGFGERRESSASGSGGGGSGGPGGGRGPGGGGGRGGGPPGGGNMGFGGPRGGGPGGMFGGGSSGKRYSLTLSINSRNVINHVNLGPRIGDLSSPFFGQSISTGGGFGPGGGGGGGAAGNRKLEFMLRFSF